MKVQVIFYSALAFLIKLAASIPYAADLQRYSSSYQNRPPLDGQYQYDQRYQNQGQRPYDAVYNNPAPQYQEQKPLRLNQDNYYDRNQKRYSNEGQPHIQPAVTNERYVNQQSIPSQYYTHNVQESVIPNQKNNWSEADRRINGNQPVKFSYPVGLEGDKQYRSYPQQIQQQIVRDEVRETSKLSEKPYTFGPHPVFKESKDPERISHQALPGKVNPNYLSINDIFPQILIDHAFAPSIPSVPSRNVYSSQDALKRVNDHYIQVEPVEIHPILAVHPAPTNVEQDLPPSVSARNLARAGNPVETVPELQVQPKLDVLSNPRIQHVLATTKHKKRYLVIHPNGAIEHVDSLENVAKQHPNYVLVNAGNIVPNADKTGSIITPPTKPYEKKSEPVNEQTTTVTNKNIPTIKYEPSDLKVDVIVTKSPTQLPEAIAATSQAPVVQTTDPVTPNSAPATATQSTATTPLTSASETVLTASGTNATDIASNLAPNSTSAEQPAFVDLSPEGKNANTPSQITPKKSAPLGVATADDVNATDILSKTTSAGQANTSHPASLDANEHTPSQIPPITSIPQAVPTTSEANVTAIAPNPEPNAASTGEAKSSDPASVGENAQTPTQTAPVLSPSQAVVTESNADATAIVSNQATSSVQEEPSDPAPVDVNEYTPQAITFKSTPQNPQEIGAAVQSPTIPENLQPSEFETDKEVLPPVVNNEADSAVPPPQTEPELVESSPKNVSPNTSTPPATPTTSDVPPSVTAESSENLQSPNQLTLIPQPVIESSPQPDQTTPTVLEINDQPQEVAPGSEHTAKAPLVVPVIYDTADKPPNSIDEFVVNEASNKVRPDTSEKVPDLGDSNIVANVPHEPVVWFRTSDPNFWSKLSDNHEGFDVIYFFQIHNKPKIVHDTKTTVFANGTILEEFTVTTLDFEGDEPKIKKTAKITNPEDQCN